MDRLPELRQRRPDTAVCMVRSTAAAAYTNPHTHANANASSASDMDAFYRVVESAMHLIRDIAHTTNRIQQLHAEYLVSVDQAHCRQTMATIEALMHCVRSKFHEARNALMCIASQKEQLADHAGRVADARIQEGQHAYLTRCLASVIQQYNGMCDEYRQQYHNAVVRRLKARFTNLDGSLLSEARAQQMAKELFTAKDGDVLDGCSIGSVSNGLQGTVALGLSDTMLQIMDTRNDLRRMEEALGDVPQLHYEVLQALSERSESLDDVCISLASSDPFVAGPRADVCDADMVPVVAVVWWRRRWVIVLIVALCVLVAAAAVVVPLLFTGTVA